VLITATACTSGGEPAATSSAPTSSSTTSVSSTPTTSASATEPSSPTASSEPTKGPSSSVPPELAAFQLCGTVLGLAAGFIGQIAPEQLDEGRAIAEQARAEYVDDGSGLAQKADAVLAAVEFADQTKVVATSKAFADACKAVNPGT
jgi:hypothetical protein